MVAKSNLTKILNSMNVNRSIQFGSWITINNPSIAEIMADAGFDWLCIDLEH
jgi:2-dehydro-3-deoxyglucarate aldolase